MTGVGLGQRAQAAVGKDCDSRLLLQHGHYSVRFEAALQFCACLDRPWSWLRHLRVLARSWRDAACRLLAAQSYRWFGRTEHCLMLTPELRGAFSEVKNAHAPCGARSYAGP